MSDFRGGFGPAAYAFMPAQIAAVTARLGEGDTEKLIYGVETCDVKQSPFRMRVPDAIGSTSIVRLGGPPRDTGVQVLPRGPR